MASCGPLYLISFLGLTSLLLHSARSDDTSSQLLKGINGYRASLKLGPLSENGNAACLAEQLAKQFKGEQCSNTTGSDTVPGTEQQFPNYLDYLKHCHLNATVQEDGQVMPACVPGLVPSVVLTNYTETQYNQYLNDTKFVGVGIADEGNWVVVVLTTNTPTGDYASATGTSFALSKGPSTVFSILSLLTPFFVFMK